MTGGASGEANRPVLGERYQLVSRIGTGASAQVFHAVDLRLGRQVAIKQLRPDYAKDPRFLKLFRAEAHLAAQLSHPNIVAIYDWSDDDTSGPFIVTELLSGGTLRDMIHGAQQLSLSQVVSLGLEAAQGLAFAHEQGLVHRDVKPANLLFGQEGRVRVADFGIARAVAQAAWTEPEGVLIGTARYAAPEQATSGSVDGLADVYSLALCLIEAATNEVPLLGENALSTMTVRQTADVPALDEFGGSLGPLAEPLAAAGRADRSQRSSAADLLDQLLMAGQELPVAAPLPLLDVTTIGEPVADGDPGVPGSGPVISGSGPVVAGSGPVVPGSGPVIQGQRAQAEGYYPDHRNDDEATTSVPNAGPPGARSDIAWDWSSPPVDSEARTEGPIPMAWDNVGRGPDESANQAAPDHVVPNGNADHRGQPTLRRRRSRWRILLLGLVMLLAAGGAVAALFGQDLLERTRPETTTIELGLPQFEVADFLAFDVPEIRNQADDFGWSVTVAEAYEDGTEAGDILRQSPEPGARLAPGEEIMVVISLGPELRIVPDVVGVAIDQARAAVEDASLGIGQVADRNDEAVDAGVVLEATIGGIPAQPGAEVITDTVIDVVVSSGPTPRAVPNLVGSSVDQARSALADLSLAIEVAESYSDTVPEGEIISSTPAADEVLARGSSVSVLVSLGLPFIEIPDVAGVLAAEAATQLEELGLVIEDTDGPPNRPVLITDPVAGSSVRKGTAIRIIVSR